MHDQSWKKALLDLVKGGEVLVGNRNLKKFPAKIYVPQIVVVANFGVFYPYGADVMEWDKQIRREKINRSIISAYLGSLHMSFRF